MMIAVAKSPDRATVGAGFWLDDGSYVTLREFVRRRLGEMGRDQNWLSGEMGISPASLSQILSGGREPKLSQLDTMADRLGVNIVILLRLSGYGSASTQASTALTGEITEDGTVTLYDLAQRITAPRVSGPVDTLDGMAFTVRTSAMGPRYQPGETIWTDSDISTPTMELLGQPSIIRLKDGRHLLRTPLLSPDPALYTLLTPTGRIETGADIDAGAAIVRITTA
jgi:transcriptional regulator with XRE-family HTH domain